MATDASLRTVVVTRHLRWTGRSQIVPLRLAIIRQNAIFLRSNEAKKHMEEARRHHYQAALTAIKKELGAGAQLSQEPSVTLVLNNESCRAREPLALGLIEAEQAY